MNLQSATYHTKREVQNAILKETGLEDEADITTDTSDNSEPDFDSSDDDEFNPIQGANYNARDDNMDVD
jgi:hypothetical protein